MAECSGVYRDQEILWEIIEDIISTGRRYQLDKLKTILRSGRDVNEILPHERIPLLSYAIRYSHGTDLLEIVHLLLEHWADLNVTHRVKIALNHTNKSKWVHRTALHEAALRGSTDIVKILLDAGAKCTKSGALQNPIAVALQNHDCPPDLIRLLLKHGADPNDHDDQFSNIPLFNAIDNRQNGSIIVKLLLGHGANPNVTYRVNIGGYEEGRWVQRTALNEAARQGSTEMVKILLDAGAKCTKSGALQNPIPVALQNHDCPPDLIDLLLQHGADPNDHDDQFSNIPLFNAIDNRQNGSIIVKLLLEHGANPNVTCRKGYKEIWIRTALADAAQKGCTEVVKVLLDAGAKYGKSALREAVYWGRTEVVKILLDAGAKFPENALALALRCGNSPTDLIELLLNHGKDPNDHDGQFENIPLINAIVRSNDDQNGIVQLLLEHGANPNVTCREYIEQYEDYPHEAATEMVNPLVLALQKDNCPPDLIELLLKHGADVNYTVVGVRPFIRKLSQYTFRGHHMFLELQLDLFFLHGGNINMEDGEGRTALECAIIDGGHSKSIRWLIRHGADTLLKFKGDFMTLMRYTLFKWYFKISKRKSFPETPLMLLQAGMRVPHGAREQLSSMEVAISTWLQEKEDTLYSRDLRRTIKGILGQLEKSEEPQMVQWNLKKCTFPEYWSQQMADLQEFSDETLHVYQEDTCISPTQDLKQRGEKAINYIHSVLEFLSQPQSLQWYCRHCVRENLVSLQPSVVKTLPLPSRLKCYILCHEI